MANYTHKKDEDLMRLVQKGDEGAFAEIYSRYSRRILLFLYRMLGQNEDLAQDFLQDVFYKIAAAPEKFNPEKNFKSWIFTVTANLCKNHFRSKGRHYEELSEMTSVTDSGQGEWVDQQLFKTQLNKELDKLAPIYKEAFLLKYHEGLSLAEIAEISDCPVGTVKSRLYHVTRTLAKKLIHHQPH